MKQIYTWRLYPVKGGDVDQLLEPLKTQADRILTYNRWVPHAEIEVHDHYLLVKLTMSGHDRWWIRRRAPHLINSIAMACDLPVSQVVHEEILTPANLRRARFWSSGEHNKGERITTPADGSEPEPPRRGCRNCSKRNFHWYGSSGWHTGDEIKDIDLRRRAF